MYKKFLSMLLSIFIIISMFVPVTNVYANSNDSIDSNMNKTNNIEYNEYNEYEIYKSIVSKTNSELLAEGYTEENIKNIRKFDYEKEVKKRANLPNDMLKKYGYTENEIKELKAIAKLDNIPEANLMSIARATLGSSIRVKNVGTITENNKKVRYVDLQYTFKWKKIPIFTSTDLIVIAFDSNNSSKYSYKKVSGYNLKANMTDLSSGKVINKQTVNWIYDTSSNKAVSAKFPIAVTNLSGTVLQMCWDGIGVIRLTNPNTSSRLYIDACYGHTIINIVPSFSINITGTASFGVSLRKGMDARHDCGLYYSNFKIDDSYIYDGVVIGV